MSKKGKRISEPWVICPNAKCYPWAPENYQRSWRKVSQGPGCCKFCDTPFPIKDPHEGSQWKSQNSKGRIRSAPPPPELVSDGPALERFLKTHIKVDDAKAEQISVFAASMFPPKPKTEGDLIKESAVRVDKAQKARDHLARTVSAMETSFKEQCEELLKYQTKLEEHKAKLDAANVDLQEAQNELLSSRASRPEPKEVSAPDPMVIASTFDPSRQLTSLLGQFPALAGLPNDQMGEVHNGITQFMHSVIHDFANRVKPPVEEANGDADMGNAAAACTGDNAIPADAAAIISGGGTVDVVSIVDECKQGEEVADSNMTQSSVKRGIGEVSAEVCAKAVAVASAMMDMKSSLDESTFDKTSPTPAGPSRG